MTAVGDFEFRPQRCIIALFRERLGYHYQYLGDWRDREGNRNIERGLLEPFLAHQRHSPVLIAKVLREFKRLPRSAAAGTSTRPTERPTACSATERGSSPGSRRKPPLSAWSTGKTRAPTTSPSPRRSRSQAVTPSGPNWCSTSTALPSA